MGIFRRLHCQTSLMPAGPKSSLLCSSLRRTCSWSSWDFAGWIWIGRPFVRFCELKTCECSASPLAQEMWTSPANIASRLLPQWQVCEIRIAISRPVRYIQQHKTCIRGTCSPRCNVDSVAAVGYPVVRRVNDFCRDSIPCIFENQYDLVQYWTIRFVA